MPTRRDVEVALDFIALETAVNATAIHRRALGQFRRFLELLRPRLAHMPQDMRDVRVLLLGLFALLIPLVQVAVHAALHLSEPEQFARIVPDLEVCVFFGQEVAGHDAVHGGVLDVDVQVAARHCDHDVQVQLEFMPDAALDAEVVGFGAAEPGG